MLRLRGFEYFERFGEVLNILKVFEELERSKTAQKQKNYDLSPFFCTVYAFFILLCIFHKNHYTINTARYHF